MNWRRNAGVIFFEDVKDAVGRKTAYGPQVRFDEQGQEAEEICRRACP